MDKLKKKALSLGATDLKKSSKKNKKFVVVYNNKLIHFGDSRYEDFTQHRDKKRQKNYLTRAKGIKNKHGELTHKDKNSPNFWSINLLWT